VKHKIHGIAVIFAALFILSSCDNAADSSALKMPGEMSWERTDITEEERHPVRNFNSMWGSSASDLWLAGENDDLKLFHYDGKSWTNVPYSARYGGPIDDSVYLTTVFGFSPGDIWFGGFYDHDYHSPDSACILHYDGVNWETVPIHGRNEKATKIVCI
jgi:hypothetical protein